MNTVKKFGAATAATFLLMEQAFAIDFWKERVEGRIAGDQGTADVVVQRLVGNVMLFLAIIAVLYGLYGGFLMLTAGGDDEKVKTGRTILIQVGLGLVVIFLANSIVQFVITQILK